MPRLPESKRSSLLFPSADGVQPDHPCQWWYWSGRLQSSSGRRYGFQAAFFAAEAVRGLVWGQMAHWALVDLDAGEFASGSRIWLGAPERIEGRFRLACPTSEVAALGGDGRDRLHLRLGDLDLDLRASGGLVVSHYAGQAHDYAFGGDPARASTLTLDVLATGTSRTEAATWRTLIELDRLEPNDSRSSIGSIDPFIELLGANNALDALVRAGLARVEFVNLKQFRSASDPDRACYQAIVRTRARVLGLRRATPTAPYAYRIHPQASHPLVDELGVAASGHVRGVFADFDFDLEPGDML